MRAAACLILTLVAIAVCAGSPAWAQAGLKGVRFVGCPQDGQMGPVQAPSKAKHQLRLRAALADRLAYYETSAGFGVLGPRGWFCAGIYGSNGETLVVSPKQHAPNDFITRDIAVTEPAVVLSHSYGGTSGRFTVARIAARIFPIAHDYVDSVIDEGLEPRANFPSGPYPADRLVRKSDTLVEFTTPPNAEGLGTTWLDKGTLPIEGVIILSPEQDMQVTRLLVRLPPELRSLAPRLIADIEVRRP